MKLSEIRGEAALDVLADIMEPAVEIMTDGEVRDLLRVKSKRLEGIVLAIKKHKRAVISIMAAVNLKTVDEYLKEVNILTLPLTILEIMNDPDLAGLFTSAGMNVGAIISGAAMASTEAPGE